MRKKRGSLQLSINAVVILILAITMLGLGLSFIKDLFGGTVGKLKSIESQIEEQEIKELRTSKQRLNFRYEDIKLERNKPKDLYFAVLNDRKLELGQTTQFYISISCYDAIGITGADVASVVASHIQFETFEWTPPLEQDSIKVMKIITEAQPDSVQTTYQCALTISDPAETRPYAQKSFFVTVV